MAGHLIHYFIATTMTFFASFFTAGSAEPMITHLAAKGTWWKATVLLAGVNQKDFSIVFFGYKPKRSCFSSGKRWEQSPMGWKEGLGAVPGIAIPQESCRHWPPTSLIGGMRGYFCICGSISPLFAASAALFSGNCDSMLLLLSCLGE